MKRKPEILLQDAFKAFKPALIIADRSVEYGFLENALHVMKNHPFHSIGLSRYLTTFFHMTKPLTGLTIKESQELNKHYIAIRSFRSERQSIEPKITNFPRTQRLWPLSVSQYNEFAKRYYKKHGEPKFGKRIITGVKFGDPKTEWYTNHRGFQGALKHRIVGVKINFGSNKLAIIITA